MKLAKKAVKRIAALTALLTLVVVSHTDRVMAGVVEYQIKAAPLPEVNADNTKIQAVLVIVFGLVGALSLLMVTIGGFKYIAANGDAQAIGKAKNTILYALIGLIVSILSTVIVTFVIGRVG